MALLPVKQLAAKVRNRNKKTFQLVPLRQLSLSISCVLFICGVFSLWRIPTENNKFSVFSSSLGLKGLVVV